LQAHHTAPIPDDFLCSATMNQLYHPLRTATFFNMLKRKKDIPVFCVTNNVVHDLAANFSDEQKKLTTMERVTNFLVANG
jgi:hypothetical protein